MKIKSIAASLSLGVFGSLLAVTLSQTWEINRQRVFAQEATSLCPLSDSIAITFQGAKCKKVTLQMPQTFFRYYGGNAKKDGRYLTTEQYQTNEEVIKNLALNQEWGNTAEKMVSVTLPAGTTVYQGIVAPQIPASCYPGGGQQTFFEDSRDPNLFWTEGPDLTLQPFTCP